MQGRLLLVSNRLPITIKRSEDGTYAFSMSSGGLVTGLSGLSKSTTFQWYGWPGLEVPEAEAGPMVQRLKDEYGAVPVFVDDELADRHYNGFSSMPLLPRKVFNNTNTLDRFHPLAPLPLSPRRNHIRRVSMDSIQGGQPPVRKDNGEGRTRWRFNMGSRLSSNALARDAARGNRHNKKERQNWLLPPHSIPE